MSDNKELTPREIANALDRMANAIEKLTAEMRSEFATLRTETVRKDVYEVQHSSLDRRVNEVETRSKQMTTALIGLFVSVAGSIVFFLIRTGLSNLGGGATGG